LLSNFSIVIFFILLIFQVETRRLNENNEASLIDEERFYINGIEYQEQQHQQEFIENEEASTLRAANGPEKRVRHQEQQQASNENVIVQTSEKHHSVENVTIKVGQQATLPCFVSNQFKVNMFATDLIIYKLGFKPKRIVITNITVLIAMHYSCCFSVFLLLLLLIFSLWFVYEQFNNQRGKANQLIQQCIYFMKETLYFSCLLYFIYIKLCSVYLQQL
jgi:hypothetical protein